ncbi:ROK family protein [Microterricola pindariensis]|uniref:ROK family protein n=1 Tax=Microterricola pindariensis TaxID=478010 RepID=UPI001E344D88|nr:ROK family protein [Microterricola pindariensis]
MAQIPAADSSRPARRGNNLDDVRRNNLAVVLGISHARGRVSRAELTRATGLNRSTIGALVAELVELGLVDEAEPSATKLAGRPSPVIVPREDVVAIAVNPEIDAVTIALVGLSGRVLSRIRHDTAAAPSAEEVVAIVAAAVAGMRGELGASTRFVGVGLAVPGLVRASDGVVILAPHLGWRDVPIAEMLAAELQLPVTAANDASAGVVAESQYGAGRGARGLVYLNGGASGIGGGIALDGQLFEGAAGYAGEFGHTFVNSAGSPCHCGASGCLETEVRRAPLLALLGLDNTRSEELEETLLAHLARPEGPDAAVAALLERQSGFLAIALRNIVNALNPELVLLGGFLGTLYAVAPERLSGAVSRSALPGAGDGVRFGRAELGNELLVVGAALLAFKPVLEDPASVAAPAG